MNASMPRYRSLSSWLKRRFGGQVRKITLDAGLGCPNRDGTLGLNGCLYCNPRGSGTGASSEGLSLSRQIERGVAFLSRRYHCSQFIAYFQSFTNTYAEPERLSMLYREALERPEVVALAVGTRPDCVPDPVLDVLVDAAQDQLVWVEYGLQSIHDRTLKLICRGHNCRTFLDAVRRTRGRGIHCVVHLILGLPGESLQDMIETGKAVADCGIWGVKLHPLYVIRGSGMEKMFREGAYVPMTLDEATEAILAVLEVLRPETIIHRMTSDPHREELVAPLWMLDRVGVRNHLTQAMEAANFLQGSRYASVRGSDRGDSAKK